MLLPSIPFYFPLPSSTLYRCPQKEHCKINVVSMPPSQQTLHKHLGGIHLIHSKIPSWTRGRLLRHKQKRLYGCLQVPMVSNKPLCHHSQAPCSINNAIKNKISSSKFLKTAVIKSQLFLRLRWKFRSSKLPDRGSLMEFLLRVLTSVTTSLPCCWERQISTWDSVLLKCPNMQIRHTKTKLVERSVKGDSWSGPICSSFLDSEFINSKYTGLGSHCSFSPPFFWSSLSIDRKERIRHPVIKYLLSIWYYKYLVKIPRKQNSKFSIWRRIKMCIKIIIYGGLHYDATS